MHGDVLLITDEHKKVANQIIELLGDIKQLNKFTLAIGGESGSGKSELSHLISKSLKKQGIFAKLIHTDDYYTIPPKERPEWRKKNHYSNVGLDEIDWLSLNFTIENFKKGKECTMPNIDLLTDQVDRLITNFEKIDVLILDGLYSLKIDVDLKIMIDLTYKETKIAQLVREKESMDDERLRVLEKEHEAVQSLKSRADYIITKDFVLTKNIK